MTNAQHLVAACGAMTLLVSFVGIRLAAVRIVEMRAKRIHPQAAANSLQVAAKLERVQASDNFKNLFEVPVLFYTLAALSLALGQVPDWLVVGAWGFVLLRYLHSVIHCSYNKVLHRFLVFTLGLTLLTGLWVGFLIQVLGAKA